MLTVGGLFSGIGGWELGLQRAGMRVLWHCEADPYCRRVLERHWPGVPCYPDVRELRGADVEPVDVLAGGFPCQDISSAGRRAGIEGERSGLWSEYARLVGELRPRYVLVENVADLLGRGLGRVLGDLAALGYDAEWDCIPAAAVGAPHLRDRVWIVAYPAVSGSPDRHAGALQGRTEHGRAPLESQRRGGALPDASGGRREARQRDVRSGESDTARSGPADVAYAEGERRSALRATHPEAWADVGPVDAGRWEAEPDVGRVADGVPARVDRLRGLGNALVPQIAEWIGRRIVALRAHEPTSHVPLGRRPPKMSGLND